MSESAASSNGAFDAEVAGSRVRIECFGVGLPTLVFVHGFACDRHDWSAQVRALSSRYRVVTFDLPGHGDSAIPGVSSVAKLAAAVAEVKTRYGGDRVVLIGHSLGCRLILEAFRQSPAGIVGLVLADGSRMATDDVEKSVAVMSAGMDAVGVHGFVAAAFEGMFGPNSDPALSKHAKARVLRLDEQFARSLVPSVTRWDAESAIPALKNVDIPVLVLQSTHIDATLQWGKLESGMTNEWTRLVSEHIPDAQLRVVPGVGHFLQVEAPEAVSEAIDRFAQHVLDQKDA